MGVTASREPSVRLGPRSSGIPLGEALPLSHTSTEEGDVINAAGDLGLSTARVVGIPVLRPLAPPLTEAVLMRTPRGRSEDAAPAPQVVLSTVPVVPRFLRAGLLRLPITVSPPLGEVTVAGSVTAEAVVPTMATPLAPTDVPPVTPAEIVSREAPDALFIATGSVIREAARRSRRLVASAT